MVMVIMPKMTVWADAEAIQSGICGDSANYTITKIEEGKYKLSITGSGQMEDYDYSSTDNWKEDESINGSITEIQIGNGITTIGSRAFSACSSLESINIPNSVTIIGYRAFDGCTSLKSINIPDGITNISKGLFSGCDSLKTITMPNSVTTIA